MARGEELRTDIVRRAGDLFYRERINSTGVDRVCEAVGVSKRTLYHHFSSKDELVTAALEARSEELVEILVGPGETARAAGASETEQILAVFRHLGDWMRSDQFCGCPYLNVAGEIADRNHPALAVARHHKNLLRAWFESTARRGRLTSPTALSWQLMLVMDGALVDSELHGWKPVASRALDAAGTLIAAAATHTDVRPATRQT